MNAVTTDIELFILSETLQTNQTIVTAKLRECLAIAGHFAPEGDRFPGSTIDQLFNHRRNNLPRRELSAQQLKEEGVWLAGRAVAAIATSQNLTNLYPDASSFEIITDEGVLNTEELTDATQEYGLEIVDTYPGFRELVQEFTDIMDPSKEHHTLIEANAGFAFGTLSTIAGLQRELQTPTLNDIFDDEAIMLTRS